MKIKQSKINKIWSDLRNSVDWKLEKYLYSKGIDIDIINIETSDDFIDMIDNKQNEYTVYKEDIRPLMLEYYDESEEISLNFGVNKYVISKIVENTEAK